MTLFDHYKATPAEILGSRSDALSDVTRLAAVKDDIREQHRAAHGFVLGLLLAPLETTFDPAYRKVDSISRLRLVSSASLLQWASSVTTYNHQIDVLNAQYESAAGSAFGVDADRYFMHGAGVPMETKERQYDEAVASAKAALLARLRAEKRKLDAELDDAADEAKTTLNRDPDDAALQSLFQAGLLPLQIPLLFPSIDVSQVDVGRLLENLKRSGLLPPETDVRNLQEIYRILSSDAGDPDRLREDFPTLRNGLGAASPEGLAALLSLLDPSQLAKFDATLQEALDDYDDEQLLRLDVYSPLLSKLPPELIPKLLDGVPDLEPGFDSTDAYLDGAAPQRLDSTDGWHWGDPTGPLFAVDDDGDPANDYLKIQQGALGDCWMITNLIAASLKNPSFGREHVQSNPNGTVTVTVYDSAGAAHHVTVTRRIVLDEDGGNALAHSSDGSTWPTYYEKAMALAYGKDEGGAPDDHEGDDRYDREDNGNYAGLEWDWAHNATSYVSSGGGREVDNDYDDVREEFESGHPVMVATKSDDEGLPDELKDAYHTRHVYYVKSFEDGHIVLGNPWGPDYPDVRATPDQFEDWFDDASAIDLDRR